MKKTIGYSIAYTILTFTLLIIYALLIMENINLNIVDQSWYALITYISITTIPIGILRLIGNKEILPIKIGLIPMIIFSIVLAGFDASFTIYSILNLSILNIVKDKNKLKKKK